MGLYNSDMSKESGYYTTVGIVQSGSPGSYTYSISYNLARGADVAYNSGLYPSALAAAADCPGNRRPLERAARSATGSRMDSRRTLARLPVPRRLGLIRSTARSPGKCGGA